MDLQQYFTTQQGTGIMSTADSQGRVDAAIYARPHVMADGTLAMIMRERLTHKNLQENPYAAYLFIEASSSRQGVRLFLKKVREDDDSALIEQLTRRTLSAEEDKAKGAKFIVYFEVKKALKLIGGEEI